MPVIQPLPCHVPYPLPRMAGRPPVTPVIHGSATAQGWHVRTARINQLGILPSLSPQEIHKLSRETGNSYVVYILVARYTLLRNTRILRRSRRPKGSVNQGSRNRRGIAGSSPCDCKAVASVYGREVG